MRADLQLRFLDCSNMKWLLCCQLVPLVQVGVFRFEVDALQPRVRSKNILVDWEVQDNVSRSQLISHEVATTFLSQSVVQQTKVRREPFEVVAVIHFSCDSFSKKLERPRRFGNGHFANQH